MKIGCVISAKRLGLACCLALSLSAAGVARADDADAGNKAFESHDYATAIKLLTPLAQQGNLVAELDIGLMYFSGNGFPQDRVEAAKWFLAAARQGNVGAQTDIGIAYATGQGVPLDRVQAYMWFSLAAAQRGAASSSENYRDHIAGEMTPDQVKQAQELANKCRASAYRECASN